MKTKVINLIGGPGVGKSTLAAMLFAELKKRGAECELVLEYAKEKLWEESKRTLDNQLYIFAKQNYRQWRLKGKVEYIITDSPLLLSIIYDKEHDSKFRELVKSVHDKYDNLNYFISRHTEYKENGRLQTYDEAVKIDGMLKKMLDDEGVKYVETTPESFIDDVLRDIDACNG